MPSAVTFHTSIPSPLGRLRLVGTAEPRCAILLPAEGKAAVPDRARVQAEAPVAEARRQLDRYLAGRDGHLVGYGGGRAKARLLAHEARVAAGQGSLFAS